MEGSFTCHESTHGKPLQSTPGGREPPPLVVVFRFFVVSPERVTTPDRPPWARVEAQALAEPLHLLVHKSRYCPQCESWRVSGRVFSNRKHGPNTPDWDWHSTCLEALDIGYMLYRSNYFPA